jgi:hypothetical protein
MPGEMGEITRISIEWFKWFKDFPDCYGTHRMYPVIIEHSYGKSLVSSQVTHVGFIVGHPVLKKVMTMVTNEPLRMILQVCPKFRKYLAE